MIDVKGKLNLHFWHIVFISLMVLSGCDSSSGRGGGESGGDITPEACTGEGGAVYVRTGGSDSNPGTSDEPKLTIQAGIDCADSLFVTGEVRVAQGTYTVDGTVSIYQDYAGIVMKDGISLYGGYSSSDWSQHDPDIYVTTITDSSSAGSGGVGDPGKAIYCYNLTLSVIIDGFSIEGGSGEYNTAVGVENASPVIRNCVITGGKSDGDPGSMNYGIYVYNSAPDIYNNTINGGSGTVYTYGIRSDYSSAWYYDNDIYGGSGSTGSYGIDEYYSDSLIERNLINSGNSTGARTGIILTGSESLLYNNVITTGISEPETIKGIYLSTPLGPEPVAEIVNNTLYVGCADLSVIGISISSAQPVIINNIIFAADCDAFTQYGIDENSSTADPSSVENNDIYNFDGGGMYSSGFYHDDDNTYVLDVLTSGNFTNSHSQVLSTPTGHNNISVDPQLNMTDLSPTASTPSSVLTGGQNYSSEFTDDFNGNSRTGSWSIGAYEF